MLKAMGVGRVNFQEQCSFSMGTPLISIVIRTYFREDPLAKTLESIANSNYPKDMIEVIVVNDPKDEGAEKVVDLFREKHPEINCLLINPSINSATFAWNLGIRHSRGEIVGVSPDDIIFHPDSIRRAIDLLRSNCNVAAVTFTCIFEKQSIMSEVHHMRFIGNITNSVSTVFLLTFYRKRTLEAVGLYREDLGPPATIHEDWELGSRIRKQGYTIMLDGTMVQTHLEHQEEHQEKKSSVVKLEKPLRRTLMAKLNKWTTIPWLYANSYLRRNYKTFFEVMKSSPLSQQAEYFSYFLMPIVGLGLLIVNPLFTLIYALFLVAIIDAYSFAEGYYRVFGISKRSTYPIVLIFARIVRSYLSVLGLLTATIAKGLGKLR